MFNSYVAIGDSFTEGVGDEDIRYPNQVRGWADRTAEGIAAHNPDFTYANLAIRGRKIDAIIEEQVEPAIALKPDLLSFSGGGNDLIRPKVNLDHVFKQVDQTLQHLSAHIPQVMVFTYSDLPAGFYSTTLRGRYALYNEFLREMVEKYSLILIDWWRMYPTYRMDAYWASDKIHMSTLGHAFLANKILERFGYEPINYTPEPEPDERTFTSVSFVSGTAVPWISRRVRGVSSGDTMQPKYPTLTRPPHWGRG